MNILKMAKEQHQKDKHDSGRESDAKQLEEEIAKTGLTDAMDSVILPPADDFRPPEVIPVGWDYGNDTPAYKPPVEKTPEEQDAIAVLSSMPAIMEPVKYRQLQIDTMNTAKAQKAALEKVQAKVTGAINHRDLVIKGCELVLATLDGKPPAKPTPPKKPAATTGKRKGRPPKNTPPIAGKVEEEKAARKNISN